MKRNQTALFALAFSALSLTACGSKDTYAGTTASPSKTDTTFSQTQVTTSDTTPPASKHHSVIAGALAGAAAGHVAGHHALAGAAVGALVQHERNRHQTR